MVGWKPPDPLVRTLYWRPEGSVITPSFFAFWASHSVDSAFDALTRVKHDCKLRKQSRRMEYLKTGDAVIVMVICYKMSLKEFYRSIENGPSGFGPVSRLTKIF